MYLYIHVYIYIYILYMYTYIHLHRTYISSMCICTYYIPINPTWFPRLWRNLQWPQRPHGNCHVRRVPASWRSEEDGEVDGTPSWLVVSIRILLKWMIHVWFGNTAWCFFAHPSDIHMTSSLGMMTFPTE